MRDIRFLFNLGFCPIADTGAEAPTVQASPAMVGVVKGRSPRTIGSLLRCVLLLVSV